jgi:serine/threonine protein kinase
MMWGPYTLAETLGEGTQGTVRVGVKDGVRYAIKKFKEEQDFGVSGAQEISLLLQAQHPHIIKACDRFRLFGAQYLVMELADSNLCDYIHKEKPSEEEILCLFQQLTSALCYLQENGFSHCDIKPDNVLIKDGKVKLADMGISVYKNIQVYCCNSLCSPQDHYLNNKLKPKHVERYRDIFTQKVNHQASDIWALGITFLYMLTGDARFYRTEISEHESREATPKEMRGKMYEFMDDPLSYLEKLVDKKWVDVLLRMLNPDQRQRIHLAREVLSLLSTNAIPGSGPIFYNLDIAVTPDRKLHALVEWLEDVFEELEINSFVSTATLACLYYVYDDLTDKGKDGEAVQCLGCACLYLMCKIYGSKHISSSDLVYYTANSYSPAQILVMEMRVFSRLGGRVYFSTLATLCKRVGKDQRALLRDPLLYSATNLEEYLDNLSLA